MARVALPSHEKVSLTRPEFTSDQLITLKVGSRIHIHATVESTVGTMNGSSRKARARFRPRNCWLITRAMPSPPTIFSSVATIVYTNVLRVTLPEHGILRHRHEVGEADEDAGLGHPPLGQAQEHAVEERYATNASRNRTPGASISHENTLSRSTYAGARAAGPSPGRPRDDAGPTAIDYFAL